MREESNFWRHQPQVGRSTKNWVGTRFQNLKLGWNELQYVRYGTNARTAPTVPLLAFCLVSGGEGCGDGGEWKWFHLSKLANFCPDFGFPNFNTETICWLQFPWASFCSKTGVFLPPGLTLFDFDFTSSTNSVMQFHFILVPLCPPLSSCLSISISLKSFTQSSTPPTAGSPISWFDFTFFHYFLFFSPWRLQASDSNSEFPHQLDVLCHLFPQSYTRFSIRSFFQTHLIFSNLSS